MTALLVYGLGAAVCWGTADFYGGLQSRSLPALSVTLWSQIIGGLGLAALLLASGQEVSRGGFVWGIATGLFGGFALICFYRALAVGVMSLVAPISASGAAVPVVLAILMGQAPSIVTSLGITSAFGGIVLASLQPSAGSTQGARERISLILALGAAFGFGMFYVLLDRGAELAGDSTLWVVGGARIGSLALLGGLIAVGRRRAPWPGRRIAYVGLIGEIDTLANMLFTFGAVHDQMGVVAVLASLYPVATVLLGRIVLAERLSYAQQVGVSFALIGVVLLSLA